MGNLKLQRRLAADILKCGKRKVRFNPDHEKYIEQASSRDAVRSLIESKIIAKRDFKGVSRGRTRMRQLAKKLGRHCGHGKRRGTREARMPSKLLWIKRQRTLRELLRSYRDSEKITRTLYSDLYAKCKGNMFKNKRVLVEHIVATQKEQAIELQKKQDLEARRQQIEKARKLREEKEKADRLNFAKTGQFTAEELQ
ncbi:Ribosomal protein L19 [Giardia muris]|uniref:Ribosomal protein L19 n=1 Tax=Giardia muris TaxID=5742 RepID=A0A4Z1SWI7_GIAMU|nr:Ribosomal protein L19 [Giardia muris]|eukprot:TNJ29225.1 Ribosomal protein L19 [Giardia muris]